jgi:hypothetical protein
MRGLCPAWWRLLTGAVYAVFLRLPWWLSIAATTILVRTSMLPLVYIQVVKALYRHTIAPLYAANNSWYIISLKLLAGACINFCLLFYGVATTICISSERLLSVVNYPLLVTVQ